MYNPENKTYTISTTLYKQRLFKLKESALRLSGDCMLAYHTPIEMIIRHCNNEIELVCKKYITLTEEYIITLNEHYKQIRKKIREQDSL